MTTKNSTSKKVETGKKKIRCKVCGKEKTLNAVNYYQSNREEYKEYGCCPTCKICLRGSTIDVNLGTVTKESIVSALRKLDKPLVDEIFLMIKEREVSNEKFLGEYVTQLNISKYKNLTYADTVDLEIEQEKRMNAKVESVKEELVTEEMRRFWGRNAELTNQDYLDLQAMFDNFTRHEESMDFKKESDYKQLCKFELQKSKIEFNIDEINKVEKLQKMIDTLSDNLGIQAIQKQDAFDNNKFVLGLITRYHEDVKKKPIRRWVEDLGNVDPLRDIIKTDYLGGMAQALGVSNPEIEDAKKRWEEFSVQLEEIYDDEEGDS